MKKIKLLSAVLAAMLCGASCSHNLTIDTELNVYLDKENTYKAGRPIVFDIEGNEDYAVFFSGEEGHVYEHRHRTEIDQKDVLSASLTIDMEFRWGLPSLRMFISHDFDGMTWSDYDADKATLQGLYAQGMPGWQEVILNGNDISRADQTFSTTIDISDYVSGLAIAYRYESFTNNYKSPQASYRWGGTILMNYEGMSPVERSILSIGPSYIWMNDQIDPENRYSTAPYGSNQVQPYLWVNASGPKYFNYVGCEAKNWSYEHEMWIVNNAVPLNRVSPDTGVTVKNFQNKLSKFRYVYDTPGTYTATFVGFNETLEGRSEVVKNIKVIITE